MSISIYHHKLLCQSTARITQNYNTFFKYFESRCYLLSSQNSLTLPALRYIIFDLIHKLPSHNGIWLFVNQNTKTLYSLLTTPAHVEEFCMILKWSAKNILGKKYTLAVRHAWKEAMFIFANIIMSELHHKSNVIDLEQYRQKKLASLI